MKPCQCTFCFKQLEGHTAISDIPSRQPGEGDFSICIYFGTISKFDKDGNLIPLTTKEDNELKETDFVIWSLLHRAKYYIDERVKQN